MIIGIKNTIPISNNLISKWLPSDESTLEAWYRNKEGITEDVGVASWADSSSNSYDMVQATDSQQPAYNASTGALTFDDSDEQYLKSSSDIGGTDGLDTGFVIGFKINAGKNNIVNLGHSDSSTEMIKFGPSGNNVVRVKPASSNVDFTMESGHNVQDDCSWIIVRK